MIFIRTDILNPYQREIISQDHYSELIDFLQDKYPSGFDKPTDISINGLVVNVEDYDRKLNDDDIVVLLDRTALPVGLIGGWFITALANLAISVTLSYVANKLFAPDAPTENAAPSSVYNINNAQNTAMFGSPIPIIYGKVRMYPSMVVQPYYKFIDNIEYLYHVLCVGQGTCTTDEILIGDDIITNADGLEWKLLNQSDFYNIPLNGYGVHLTKTLTTPQMMEIEVPEDGSDGESEKYTISAEAEAVEVDYTYPEGLRYYESDGETTAIRTEFKVYLYTESGGTYTLVDTTTIYKNVSTSDPVQETLSIDVSGYSTPVYVSFEKTLNRSLSYYVTTTYIKRVKEIHPNEDFTNLYGDITLLACKIKATDTISARGQVSVNGYFERTDVGNLMHEVLTDIYTNTTYGGALSSDDLDFPVTTETVDCAYEQSMTVFDAMRKPAIAQEYSVYLAGMDVILKKDAANTVTSGMYNEMNIIRNSFKAQYLFKEEYPTYDGIEVQYIDGDGFKPVTYTYPETSTRPQKVDLFGVVDWSSDGIGDYITGDEEVLNGTFDTNTNSWTPYSGGVLTWVSGTLEVTPFQPSDPNGGAYQIIQNLDAYTEYVIEWWSDSDDGTKVSVGISAADEDSLFSSTLQGSNQSTFTTTVSTTIYLYLITNGFGSVSYFDNISIKPLIGYTESRPAAVAEYLWKQEDSRRKIVSFQTDIQGLVPQFLDKIMVSHNALQWGEAGEVVSVSGGDIVLSIPLEDTDPGKTIVFRNIDGSVSDACAISITDSTNVTVTGIPAWVAANTFYTIQDSGTAKEFLVIAVKPSGDTVQIDCVNYDSTIYE